MDARKSTRGSTDLRGSTQPGFRPTALGEALRLLRYRTHLTRDALAERTGVAAGRIANYENDVSLPPAPDLRRLTRAFAEELDRDRGELWDDLGTLLDEQDAGAQT
ncbi:MAG: hypothetical protein JWP02_3760 [Acidimicrobiales bacterium]|nr:hypothetical protein [Acidimicrobiales bacterium]